MLLKATNFYVTKDLGINLSQYFAVLLNMIFSNKCVCENLEFERIYFSFSLDLEPLQKYHLFFDVTICHTLLLTKQKKIFCSFQKFEVIQILIFPSFFSIPPLFEFFGTISLKVVTNLV